jgi:hypothetical protein
VPNSSKRGSKHLQQIPLLMANKIIIKGVRSHFMPNLLCAGNRQLAALIIKEMPQVF